MELLARANAATVLRHLRARISITLSAELPLVQQTATAFQVATIAHRLGFGHLEKLRGSLKTAPDAKLRVGASLAATTRYTVLLHEFHSPGVTMFRGCHSKGC